MPNLDFFYKYTHYAKINDKLWGYPILSVHEKYEYVLKKHCPKCKYRVLQLVLGGCVPRDTAYHPNDLTFAKGDS